MAPAFSIFGITFAAFCVWLAVRIINRRERWAKWTFAIVLILFAAYLGSFGPVMRHATSLWAYSWEADLAEEFYRPIFWVCNKTGTIPLLWQYLNFCGCHFESAANGCVFE